MRLSDLVRPDARIARSVNLERDLGDSSTLGRYILTGKGLEIIHRLIAGLDGDPVTAWSLTGPYGMGKSAFVHFLLSLCGHPTRDAAATQAARQTLARTDPSLADALLAVMKARRIKSKGFFRVPATAAFEPINRTLARALARSVRTAADAAPGHPDLTALDAAIADCGKSNPIDSTQLVALFQEAGRIHRTPVAVVVDELGKSLEYLARHPDSGDLFILQTLAETDGIFIWVCLRQAFEAYAAGLSRLQRQEWGKVQGRFEDIPFVEPRRQMRAFIAAALVRTHRSTAAERAIRDWADHFHAEARRLDVKELAGLDRDAVAAGFPLHPLTAALLPELCVRFAQNDRTLFAFLCGGEPHALPAFLADRTLDAATFGPDRLYDYFLGAAPALALSHPGAGRWLEIHEMIQGARRLPGPQRRILKIIGLLNLISGPSGFRASRNLLEFAVSRPGRNADADLAAALDPLTDAGALIFREYADEFRLWEGTDIDIPAAIEAHKPAVAARPLESLLETAVPLLPLTASRHSYHTGTLRRFQRRWSAVEDLSDAVAAFDDDPADGLIIHAFGTDAPPSAFPQTAADGRPVLVAYAREADRLRDRAMEAAAAEAVLTELPELARDGVARREARHRAESAQTRLKSFLTDLYAPGSPGVVWQHGDRRFHPASVRDLSSLLSRLCDETFPHCPVIRNELINRPRLTSAAARARRELIEAMLTGEPDEALGLTGTGPEVAIYRTLLLAEGLHVQDSDGGWRFVPPAADSTHAPAWSAIEKMMTAAGDRPVPLPEIIDRLRKPPIGMKDGPIPVLVCLYLLVRSEAAALFQEGAYLPFLGPEDLELMVKRPEYFAIRRFAPMGLQRRVFQVYTDLLGSAGVATESTTRNTAMVNIVGPLVQFAGDLPRYVRQTRTLGREARTVLQRLLNARDPIDLLFVELPEAVGVPAFPADEPVTDAAVERFQSRLREAITDLAGAHGRLIEKIDLVVRNAFGADAGLPALRADLQARADALAPACADDRLKPLVAALARNAGDDTDWLVSVATIARQVPVDSWRDRDLPAFTTRIQDLSRRFQTMERLMADADGRPPEARDGKEARLISVARPDGRMDSEIIWTDPETDGRMKAEMDRLIRETDLDQLKSLLVMLGEHLLAERSDE